MTCPSSRALKHGRNSIVDELDMRLLETPRSSLHGVANKSVVLYATVTRHKCNTPTVNTSNAENISITAASDSGEMKEVEELDVYVGSGSPMQTYWVAMSLLLGTAACGVLAVLACWYRRCRRAGAYNYTALEPDTSVHERLEMERKVRERASNACGQYLKSNPRYKLVDHLNDIGSRLEKHWFVVRDTSLKTERLLTLLPRGPNCPIDGKDETRDVILELFVALQHPYIYPVLDINFGDDGNKSYAFVTLPLNRKGSLKDFIYKSQWELDWNRKYAQKSFGLPLTQVQRLGRQILEALLFLREKGFPPSGHFHSGNIILQNGVARLSGLENTLMGYTSRTHPILWARAQSEPAAIDSLCFGHVLFEMCAGYELNTPIPTPGNMLDLYQYPQVAEVLQFIFENPEMRLPTIEELLLCDLFRNIDLREMRNQAQSTQIFKTHVTAKGMELLNEMKKFQSGQLKKFQVQAPPLPCLEAGPPASPQQEKSASSGDSEQDANDDAYDADANSDPDPVPVKEHRCLSLYSGSMNRVLGTQPGDPH